ncbi:MAG TPA: ribonuclease HII [Bryobacteraceae bacterium]|nr:ribonuclease HII [Bryobacteraceae bacterium]
MPAFRCVGTYERQARRDGYCLVAGIDEAGRGSLFGPVFAAAVILPEDHRIRGLRDSKLVQLEEREELEDSIRQRAICWSVSAADVFEIDRYNIYHASRLAMKRAVQNLLPAANFLLVDAMKIDLPIPQRALIHGDARCQAIAAASILAKTHRDRCLEEWDRVFPEDGLRSHKGYSTPEHRRALRAYGPTTLHRFTFDPVRSTSPPEMLPPGAAEQTLLFPAEAEEAACL